MKKRIIFNIVISIIISANFITLVNAKTNGFLTQDESGRYYLYNYDDLMKSSVRDFAGLSSPLFDDYKSKKLVGFSDNNKGYIKSEDVLKASVRAFAMNEEFKLDNFTENALEQNILSVQSSVQELLEKDNKVQSGITLPKATVEKIEVLNLSRQTKVELSVPESINVGDIIVKVNGLSLNYDSTRKKFVGIINKIYNSKDDAQYDVNVQKNDEIFEVDDIY